MISGRLQQEMTLYAGFISLAAGLSVGLSGLAAGFAVGVVGDAGVRATAQQPRLFVGKTILKNRNGVDLDFRRSIGTLWNDCCSYFGYKS